MYFSAETSENDVQAVLIDCSSVIFVDVAGARLFIQASQKKKQRQNYISKKHIFINYDGFLTFRCAPNARKLVFMCIWLTAMVRLTHPKCTFLSSYYAFDLNLNCCSFSENVLKILTSSGLMSHMNPQHIFVTVHDAVLYIQQQKVNIYQKQYPAEIE